MQIYCHYTISFELNTQRSLSVAFSTHFNLQYDMFNTIHTFVLGNTFLNSIFGIFFSPVEKQLDKLKETLSESSYLNIEGMLDKIAGISLILLSIYIVYSLLTFLSSFIFRKRLRVKILISTVLAIPFLLLAYAIFAYLHT